MFLQIEKGKKEKEKRERGRRCPWHRFRCSSAFDASASASAKALVRNPPKHRYGVYGGMEGAVDESFRLFELVLGIGPLCWARTDLAHYKL
ncbi:hypothetical protein PVK06_048649 [Gossypium arboreum]|uniref:Uncharacterized protein n=1 Tax=Gossypium arboreum TaxID=29729 RepID=A0ABR0MGG1_GOSAR|nr:hypothetical protein PVK06_048649 [Gossypium arboreum]